MGKYIALFAALFVIAINADYAHARLFGRGGGMMVCNVQAVAAEAPQPVQATAQNLTQATATKVVRGMNVAKHTAPVLERSGVLRVDMSALQAMNVRPVEGNRPSAANIAAK